MTKQGEAVPFAQLPDSWVCPLCGAPKSAFVPEAAQPAAPASRQARLDRSRRAEALSGSECALFSNLARGCEKQYKPREQALFMEIADYFAAAAPQVSDADEKLVARLIDADLSERLSRPDRRRH